MAPRFDTAVNTRTASGQSFAGNHIRKEFRLEGKMPESPSPNVEATTPTQMSDGLAVLVNKECKTISETQRQTSNAPMDDPVTQSPRTIRS